MICKCPKCSATVDIDPVKVPGNGTYIRCTECKKRFWIQKEFFAGRAIRKKGEIYCAECGEELNHTIACPNCRVLYPDFFAVLPKKSVPKQLPAISLSFAPIKDRPSKPRYKSPSIDSQKVGAKKPKPIAAMVGLAVTIALAAFGGYFYYQITLENEYSKYFVRALYAIKTGRDISHETSDKILSGMKDSGLSFGVHISAEDANRLNNVKSSADKFMSKIKNPPKKYAVVNEKLVKLYNIYSEMNSVMTSPPSSVENFRIASGKLDNDFSDGVKDMKANLPQKLSDSIQTAKARYKNLRDI